MGHNRIREIVTKSTATTLVLTVAAIVVPGASRSATAQAIMTPYQGVETSVRDADSGRQSISDGILHIRNGRQILFDDANDPRMTGEVTVTFNVNFHLVPPPVYGHGPMWGTVRIENAGGSWVGAWVGKKTTQGHSFIRAAVKGEGGYEGLHARAEYVRRTPDPTVPLKFAGTVIQTPTRCSKERISIRPKSIRHIVRDRSNRILRVCQNTTGEG